MGITAGCCVILPPMLTPADKKFLTDTFSTKKELKELRDGQDLLRKKITDSSIEKFDFKFRLDSIEAAGVRTEEKVDKILTQLDGFAGKVADLEQENKMGAITLHRHGIQIHELAQATGTKLSR